VPVWRTGGPPLQPGTSFGIELRALRDADDAPEPAPRGDAP
jgi:hypothetical protein